MASYPKFPALKPKRSTPQSNVLSGWKDIANYLGKGVRTVQRYEQTFQLPVRRPSGGPRGAVIASRPELDDWVSHRFLRPRRTPVREHVGDLKRRILEMHRLCAEGQELGEALAAQRSALHSGLGRLLNTLSDPDLWQKTEKHKEVATQQKAHATEMIEVARNMSARAIEMRTPSRRRLIANC